MSESESTTTTMAKKLFPTSASVGEETSPRTKESSYRKKTREVNLIEGKQNLVGEVKWFNRRSGFGFIIENATTTATTKTKEEEGKENDDIFVHYSAIVPSLGVVEEKEEEKEKEETIKYLMVGEKVLYDLIESQNKRSDYKVQAWNVRKLDGSPFEYQLENRKGGRRRTYHSESHPSSSTSFYKKPHSEYEREGRRRESGGGERERERERMSRVYVPQSPLYSPSPPQYGYFQPSPTSAFGLYTPVPPSSFGSYSYRGGGGGEYGYRTKDGRNKYHPSRQTAFAPLPINTSL